MKGLLCTVGLYRHEPERIATAAGFAFRCKDCGRTAPTAGDLLRIDDYVDMRRKTFDRNAA